MENEYVAQSVADAGTDDCCAADDDGDDEGDRAGTRPVVESADVRCAWDAVGSGYPSVGSTSRPCEQMMVAVRFASTVEKSRW